MLGSQWEKIRIETAERLAKVLEEQSKIAWLATAGKADDIAKALANVETCERIIGRLCNWTDQGDGGETEIGVSDCTVEGDDEYDD